MSNTEWPNNFNLDAPADVTQRIKTFIQDELAKLKEFDQKRAQWVKQNLPASYQMTYVFHEHTQRVADDVKNTVLHMGLGETVADNMYWAMLPHDIGKRRLPLHIWDTIEKPENDIKKLRRSHTELGIQIVEEQLGDVDHPFIDLMKGIMLNHHEQQDGGGFLGKSGDQLSTPVRLACIVESFDGYSIARPHFGDRDISVEGVLKRMRDEKGADIYDMELFEAFAATKLAQA